MLKIYQRYSPNATAPTTDYPLGSIRNDSVPGADDGTPLEKDWGNNIEGFHQALMAEAALTASGTPDTAQASQLLSALKIVTTNIATSLATTIAASVVKAQMRDVFYPVGTYYGNDSNPTNPAILFGFGTWVRVEGRAIMGCDGTGAGTFGVPGSQGGALTHSHTATGTALTAAQLPAHAHMLPEGGCSIPVYGTATGQPSVNTEDFTGSTTSTNRELTSSVGSGETHTHTINSASSLPPYRVAYLWRRTA